MLLKLDEKAITEVIEKCEKCRLFKVEKIRGMNPMITLQIGKCAIHGEVHSLDYSGFMVEFDSRNCEEFKERPKK